ncbi:MAG: hypothetical protein M3404_08815 [Actinomycetota bacterium]|nr:hypothetical protein [Actinomycetota bacterium]
MVLIPPMLRARAESSAADSIGDFRRQLRVLQRTSPAPGPARELPGGLEAVASRPLRGTRAVGAERPPAPRPRSPLQSGMGQRGLGRRATPPAGRPMQSPGQRARTIRRRRDVLFTLLMGMGTTFVLAMVLSTPALWVLHLVMDGLLFGFLALLVRMRSIAAEKEMKLRFLPPASGRPQPALVMRRSATN